MGEIRKWQELVKQMWKMKEKEEDGDRAVAGLITFINNKKGNNK